MKIISEYQDYYDITLSAGFDSTILYKRELVKNYVTDEELSQCFHDIISSKSRYQQPSYLFTYSKRCDYKKSSFNVNLLKIGFCGKWYNVLRLKDIEKEYYIHQNDPAFNEVLGIINKKYWNSKISLEEQVSDELFIKYQAPVLLLSQEEGNIDRRNCITSNPRLSDFTFFKVKEPYSAYQDIENYISNILLEQKELVQLNDKERIIKAGFDLKTSFRNIK